MTAVGGQLGLAYAFVEREIALSKRYWAWELVWLVYGIVTSLSVAYIGLAAPAISGVAVEPAAVSRFVLICSSAPSRGGSSGSFSRTSAR
jgi:ABC-2 type transport system permease protein